MTTHIVKTLDTHYDAILANQKRFEVLPNERDYQKGDTLYIEEVEKVDGKFKHTGRVLKAVVSYVSSMMQREGVVVVGFIPVPPDESMKKNASVEPSSVPSENAPAKAVRKPAKKASSKSSAKPRKSADGKSRSRSVPKGAGKNVSGSKKAGAAKSRK